METTEMEKLMGFAPGELEKAAAAYESGEWPAGKTVRLGRPPIADEPTKVMSGRVPESVADAFEAKAKRYGQTKAERVRELVTLDAATAHLVQIHSGFVPSSRSPSSRPSPTASPKTTSANRPCPAGESGLELRKTKLRRVMDVFVHPHAFRHGLSEEDIRYAWDNFVARRNRRTPHEDQVVVVGCDASGRLMQMVGVEKPCGVLVYHALTPPTAKVLIELGLARR